MPDQNLVRARRAFLPVVGVGIGAAILAAVAGAQPWAAAAEVSDLVNGSAPGLTSSLSMTFESGRVPVANALALVSLAGWGVLLVARGRARRLVAGLGVLAESGLLVAAVLAFSSAPERVRNAAVDLPVAPSEVALTGWYWLGLVSAVIGTAAWLLALSWVHRWPEMGRRYDAPSSRSPAEVEVASDASLDLWKAIDDGLDPTS